MAATPRTHPHQPLHPDQSWMRTLRILLGLGTLAGVGWNWYRAAVGTTESSLVESMSQFTNQANLFFAVVLIAGALRSRAALPRWWDSLRGAAAFYVVMTGLIYALLVAAPGELLRWDLEWSNLLLHRATPVLGLLGWLIIWQPHPAPWGRPLAWLLFPLAYLGYTWLRGSLVGWYPYGFLNPTGPGGWGAVLSTTAMVFVAFLAIAVVVHLFGNLRAWLATRS